MEEIPEFWKQHIKNRENRYISNGDMYMIQKNGLSGFGGRLFNITNIMDGLSIQSNNLWFIGTIPENIRKYLPDNAKVIAQWD